MIEQCGPTPHESEWLKAFLIVVNALQAIGVAYVVQRAYRKNAEDRNGRGNKLE